MALIIGVVIVLLILFGFLCYKKAPPTEAIVVTGFGLARPKVVCGKGTFVLPVLQRADRLNMRLLKIDVKTPETGVKTQNGVSLWIDSVVTIQVYSENSTVLDEEVKASGLKDAKAYIMSRQQAAISNFLGMNEQGINDKVNDVLQGNLREIVSDMTVDQILTNRKQMALSVIENARPDLAKMGLEVVTFNVQDIRDAIDGQGHNHGVIEAIGIEQEELVKKQAEIARAQAARDVACAKADAEMAANAKADKDNKTNSTANSAVSAEASTEETAQEGDAASVSSDNTAQNDGKQGTASATATPVPTATPEPDIFSELCEKHDIDIEEGKETTDLTHELTSSGVTWDEVLDVGDIPVTDEMKQEYEEIQNPVLQIEKAIVTVYNYRNQKKELSQVIETLDSLLYVMSNNPMISMNDSYSPQVSEFRSKYTQYNGMLQEENPLITADDVNTLKQIVVDAYDFLNGNGFDVSTVDANAAQLYRTELAGETTVDNSTNAAPAPTE